MVKTMVPRRVFWETMVKLKIRPGISPYKQKMGRFRCKIREISTFEGHFAKILHKKGGKQDKRPASEASRNFFCHFASILLLKTVFLVLFMIFRIFFFKNFGGGGTCPRAPPCIRPCTFSLVCLRSWPQLWMIPSSIFVRLPKAELLFRAEYITTGPSCLFDGPTWALLPSYRLVFPKYPASVNRENMYRDFPRSLNWCASQIMLSVARIRISFLLTAGFSERVGWDGWERAAYAVSPVPHAGFSTSYPTPRC